MLWFWPLVGALVVLSTRICAGETSCFLWSSAGSVVQLGSSFDVFCTLNCACEGNMYGGTSSTKQPHERHNSSTIFLKVVNITTTKMTYSCDCESRSHLDPCGEDISAGYPPDPPANISCTYNMKTNEPGVVLCTWKKGKETHLPTSHIFLSRAAFNYKEGPMLHNVTMTLTLNLTLTTSFSVPVSHHLISVWIQARNALGTSESPVHSFNLSDIVMPSTPVLSGPNCTSRKCIVIVQEPVGIQHMQIQYKTENLKEWTTFPDSVKMENLSQTWSISLLEPYRLYHFRARSKFSTGLWSQWSSNISSRTQEEAPSKALDIWVTHSSDFKQMGVYWKKPSMSIARGKILEYIVKVHGPNVNLLMNVSSNVSHHTVPFYCDCEVTVWARNSEGLSPPATMATSYKEAKHLQNTQTTVYNNTITISWKRPKAAPKMYVLEWYPESNMLEELRWLRLNGNENNTVISDTKAFECYMGAVYAFYNDTFVSRTTFDRVATQEIAPAGPSFKVKVEGNTVLIEWNKLPKAQRGGCITNYTIYLKNGQEIQKIYVNESATSYKVKDLSIDFYTLWMTASTAEGESPAGQKENFYIEQNLQLPIILVCVVGVLMLWILLCLCRSSANKHRFWVCFQCLMLEVVPDPANSKCAKKCMEDQDKMNQKPPTINLTLTQNEEEIILVDVEEVINQDTEISNPTKIPQLPAITKISSKTKPYPILTIYLKSISQDSDESSGHRQISVDNTVDYISSNAMENEDEEFSDEDEFSHISPSNNIFDPLMYTGKLTLDAVKINCGEFLQSTYQKCETQREMTVFRMERKT